MLLGAFARCVERVAQGGDGRVRVSSEVAGGAWLRKERGGDRAYAVMAAALSLCTLLSRLARRGRLWGFRLPCARRPLCIADLRKG